MFLWLYNLCFPVVFLALLPGYLWRMLRRGEYRANFGQRLGWYSPAVRARLAQGPPRIWLQAVSVGEMLVALKFIAALRQQAPDVGLILSTTTTTGYRLASDRVGSEVELMYSPIDLLPIVRRAFGTLRPASLVIVDGGLWPNQLAEAQHRGIPAALVNARLSPRSERRFRRFPRFSATLFSRLDLVCVPEVTDLLRWSHLGVPAGNIRRTGSIKYDDAASPHLPPTVNGTWRTLLPGIGVHPGRPVLLAGSTHAGEEIILAECLLALRKTFPELFLIIAPRHVERTAEILRSLQPLGLRIVRRSVLVGANDAGNVPPPDLLLLDTTGELGAWYSAATVVFIGKSLTAIGGQNPGEAISARRPVVTGPHMENFADLVRVLTSARAIVEVTDPVALQAACARLLADKTERERIAGAAYEMMASHRGATESCAALVLAQAKNSPC